MGFYEQIEHGQGRVEYIFHIGGMPWAVATSTDAISALSAANRRTMFGSETYDVATKYWADCVDIYPFLETPGAQSVKCVDGFGKLDGGNWNALIADLPAKPTLWTHGSRSIYGLEGLQAMATPRVDSTIAAGRISSACGKTATTLSWEDDLGSLLYTDANAASVTAPKVAWIGGECVAFVSAVDNVDGSYTGTMTSGVDVNRGLLNSHRCYHAPNRFQNGSPSEAICEYPLNGIIGRPYYLWAVVLDESSSIVSGPVKFRHGKVGTDLNYDGEFWSVQCLPWWKWLDTELEIPKVESHMSGYIFSRPKDEWGDMSAECYPHIRLGEYVYSTTTLKWVDVWLCDEDDTVYFKTLDELEAAILVALNAASTNGWTYIMTDMGPIPQDLTAGASPPVNPDYDAVFYAGNLPFILGWLHLTEQFTDSNAEKYAEFNDDCANGKWVSVGYGSPGDTLSFYPDEPRCLTYNADLKYYADLNGTLPAHYKLKKPRYIYQYYMQHSTMADYGGVWDWLSGYEYARRGFPIPPEPVSGEHRVYMDPATDLQTLTSADIVQVGSPDIYKLGSAELSTSSSFLGPGTATLSTLSNFAVSSVGSGGDADNYIVVAQMTEESSSEETSIWSRVTGNDPLNKGLFFPAEMIFWNEEAQPDDPWVVSQLYDVKTDTVGNIFKAILGQTVSGVNVSEPFQADWIPDYDTIDWTVLDEYMDSLPFEVYLELRYEGKINPLEMLTEELKFYGLTPTYEWNESSGQYKIGFRKCGSVNKTMATLGGRTITDETVTSDSSITTTNAYEWQLNKINLSCNWDPSSEKYEQEFEIRDHSGLAPTGGAINAVSIAPRVTHVRNIGTSQTTQTEVIEWFSAMLDGMMHPRPSQSLEATLDNFVGIGVGVPLLVTTSACHNPWTGEPGISSYAAIVSEMSIDPSKSAAKYVYSIGPRAQYGWAPSLRATTLADQGSNVWRVTDISGNGQQYCGTMSTSGWYDHWFFCDCVYNASMSAPELLSSAQYYVTAVQYGSIAPTVVTGIRVNSVTLSDYSTITGAGGYFLELYDATGTISNAEDWYLVFSAHNHANIVTQQKRYVYIASSAGQLLNADASTEPVREWV